VTNDQRYGHKGLILAICCMSLFVVSMDVTIVNVALPSIGKDLHASVTGLQWTLDAYTLVLASLLMLSGSTADRIGRRRIFQIGLAIFTLGSLLCSVAPSTGVLIAARVLQAVGGSMLNPVALSIVTNTFTEKRARARAVGVWGAVVGVSLGFGPVVGGALTDTIGWRSIFWVNVPVGIAAIILTAVFVPESRASRVRRVDPVGQILVILTLAGVVFGLIEGPELGWHSPATLGAFAVGALSLIALIRYEPRRHDPLLDMRFFKSAPFSASIITAVATFGAWGAFLFANTLYLQDTRHLSPFQAGLCTMSAGLAILVLSPLSGALVGRIGTRVPLTIAGAGIAVAAALMAVTVTPTTPIPLLIAVYTLFGAGFGMVNAPISNTAVSGMPNAQAGSAAAVASTGRQVGATLGVAIAGSVTGASTAGKVGASFADATHPLWWILVALGLVVAILGSVSNTDWAARSSKRVAPLLAEPVANR
jgi:EmrB/QacA subfamily drug resistance transporter